MRRSVTIRARAACAALALSAFALLLVAPSASADLAFCPIGSGAGQCGSPGPSNINTQRGLAVDEETGHLYVADEANNRIDVFAEDGSFLFAFGWKVNAATPEEKLQSCTTAGGCRAGSAGSGPGQFDHPTAVAVDNDPASPSQHDLYVADSKNFRVQKLEPSGEFVWAIGKGVDKTAPADLCTAASGHSCGAGAESSAEGGFASGTFLGVGPAGVLYALDNPPVPGPGEIKRERLQRFEASGGLAAPQAILLEGKLTAVAALAVDPSGNAWVSTRTGAASGLSKYTPAGALLAGPIDSEFRFGLAVAPAGTIYAGQRAVADKGSNEFNVISAYDAAGNVLRRFSYVADIGANNPINGLAAHSGAFGDLFYSEENTGIKYISLPPPGPVIAAPSVEVKSRGNVNAILAAEVNPEGKPTEVHFDYLTRKAYEDQGSSFAGGATKSTEVKSLGAEGFSLQATEALVGCPEASKALIEAEQCLRPETKYRFRIVAENADGQGNGPLEGEFTTKPPLELGAAYATAVGTDAATLHAEVNPLGIPTSGYLEYVDDADYQLSGFAEAIQLPNVGGGAAPLDFGKGEALTSRAATAFPLAPGTTYHYRYLVTDPLLDAPRTGPEATFTTLLPAQAQSCPANEAFRIGSGSLLPDCRAYELVSPLEKEGGDVTVLTEEFQRPAALEQSAESGEGLAYGSARAFGDAAAAPFTSQYIARRIAGVEWQTHSIDPPRGRGLVPAASQFYSEFKFFSPDLCDSWLATFAEPPLGEGAVAGFSNLYRRSDRLCGAEGFQALAPIAAPSGVPAGADFSILLRGVSADGSHAIFTANGKLAAAGSKEQIQLYESVEGGAPRFVCVLPGGAALKTSCTGGSNPASGTPAAEPGVISADGERIFFSAPASDEGKLYLRIGGVQTLAVSKAAEEEAGTSKSFFWGAAADGSKAIFSTGSLGGSFLGEATLYAFTPEGEATGLIAEGLLGVMGMSEDASRVYFASNKEIPGSGENSEQQTAKAGEPNLYLYEAGEGGPTISFIATLASADLRGTVANQRSSLHTSRVTPDGAHAAFESFAPLLEGYDNKGAGSGTPTPEVYRYDAETGQLSCASCNPGGARPLGAAALPPFETSMHAARVLSEDGGRLYFESADSLVARDTNAKVDVYEWEQPGTGGCTSASTTYSAQDDGCVDLLSSGQSPLDSRFVEADPGGANVFLATASGLLPQDPGGADIYDARIGGGLPIPRPPAPGCEGEACQGPASPPDDPTPASSAFQGAGNVSEAKAKKKKKAHKKAKHKRAKHNRRAGR